MEKYSLRTSTDEFLLRKKYEFLNDDYTYTTSGNDVTVTQYTGNDTDVALVTAYDEYYALARKIVGKLNIEDYNYTNDSGVVTLTLYTGSGGNVDVPIVEEM